MKNREQLPRPVRLIKPGDPDFSIVKKPEPIPMEEVKEIDSSGEIQQGHNKFYRDRRLSEEEIKKNLQRRVIEEQEYQKRQLSEQEAKELGEKSEKFLYDTCQRLLTVLVTTYPKFYLTDKNDPEERSYCYKTGTHHSRRGLMDLEDKKGIDVGLQLACRIEDQETYGLIQYDAKSRWKNVGNFRRKGKKMGLEEKIGRA